MRRRLLIAAALLLVGGPVLLIALALVVANTEWGRSRMADAVQSATAGGPVQVEIDRLTGTLPTRIGLEGLRLADRKGVFAAFDRVELAWSPLALFGGTVAVEMAAVAGGRFVRSPDLPEDAAAEPEPAGPPSLAFPAPPVAVRVDGLRVTDFEIGSGVAGRAVTLAAELSASLDSESATAGGWLSAAAAEGTARLHVDLAVVPADGTLRAELRAVEPEGGLVAALLGLPERPALDLTLSGTGTLADWQGRLAGGFGEGARVDLALNIAADEAGTRIGTDGTASLQRLLPADIGAVIGPTAEIGLRAAIASDGAIELQRVAVGVAAGTAEGSGRIDPEGTPVAADLTVTAGDLSPFAAFAGTDLAGAAEVRLELLDAGRRARVAVVGNPVVAGVALDGLAANLSADADQPLAGLPPTIAWSLDAGTTTPAIDGIDLPGLLGPQLSLRAAGTAATDGSRADADRVAVATDAAQLEAAVSFADGRVDLKGTVEAAELARFSTLTSGPLAGAATLGVDGTVLLDPLDLSAVVELAGRGLDLGDPALAGLLGPGPTVSAALTLDAADRLSVHGLSLQAESLEATGDATMGLGGGALDGRIELTAPDLSTVGRALAVDLAGSAHAAVALGGTLDAPTASASWRLAPLVVQGTRLIEVTGSATAVGLPANPSGRLDLRAVGGGEAVTLAAHYAVADGSARVEDLQLDGAGLRARGGAVVAFAGPSVDGELTVTAADLGRVGAAAGLPLSGGSLEVGVTLAPENGQSAQLSGTVRDLSLEGGTTRVAEVELSGTGRELLARPSGKLTATVGGVEADGTLVLETARLTAESDGSEASATLSLRGTAGEPFTVDATASAALAASPMRVSIDSFDAAYADVRSTLQQPVRIVLGDRPRVEDLALAVDGGRITGGGRLAPGDLDVQLAVRDLPASLVRLADPGMKLKGGIDADLAVRGSIADPAARLSISAPELRSADPALADVPPLALTAEARVENLVLTASLDARVGDGVQATARGTVGLSAGAEGAPPVLAEGAPLKARLDAEAALDRLSAFLPLDGGRAAGQASVHVTVDGTPADPAVSGTAALQDGVVEHPVAGLYLRDVLLRARGQGERLVIETLTASAVGGGTLEGFGGISFDVTEGAPADLRLVARRLRAVDTDQAEVNLDADLTFQGALPEYRLAGTVTVLPSEIRIPDQLPPSVVELEVTEVRDGVVISEPSRQEEAESGGSAPVVLDVTISVPGQVFIRGRGLDSEWGGELAVTGRTDAPAVNGALEVRRGQLGAVGRTFQFQHGRVVFDGGKPENPALDMLLTTEVAEILAKIQVSQRAQDPKIALTSEPPLPEEEVLSRILFGSPRAQLSPLQALKLAQSAAVLSGRLGSGGGITDTVRETLGVDTLDVETGDEGQGGRGASLSVGKYVAPGVFLKLQQGLSGASSKAVVEVELTDSITVETDVGADSQSRVGVNWKLDY